MADDPEEMLRETIFVSDIVGKNVVLKNPTDC